MPLDFVPYLSPERTGSLAQHALSPEVALKGWLDAHPKVANAIVYDGKGFSGAWPDWPEGLKADLADRWAAMVTWYGSGMPSPDPASFPDPIPRVNGDPSQDYDGFMMPAERGRHMYLSHVANGLALEMTGRVPWSITAYSAKHLEVLFSAEFWFIYLAPPDVTAEGYYYEALMTPATPAHVMRFFTVNHLLGATAHETVARLVGWCNILQHYRDNDNGHPVDVHAFWGPDAPPIPCSMLIDGSTYTGVPPPKFGRYTFGCGGTTEFLKSVLRAVNIPVEAAYSPRDNHAQPRFPTIHRSLSHGDDPYNGLVKVTACPGWPMPPIDALLISDQQFEDWFGAGVDLDVAENNVGRPTRELAAKYLSDDLLFCYCQDVLHNSDHAGGSVYAALQPTYTLADLEAMHLWDKLAAKAAATHHCGPGGPA